MDSGVCHVVIFILCTLLVGYHCYGMYVVVMLFDVVVCTLLFCYVIYYDVFHFSVMIYSFMLCYSL